VKFGHPFLYVLNIITIIIIIIIFSSFLQGIYTYIPETNYVPREYIVAAILSLLFMVFIIIIIIVIFSIQVITIF
jgi:hypothetical protein